MANYDFVVDSSFKPFSLQEMLVPYNAYRDAFEKTEDTYIDLSDKSDKFKYLSKTLPEGSKAREIYEGYANDLSKQAEDLAKNGLTLNNRRALTSMKRRYQGEIGRLVVADEALQRERELRRQMSAKDPSMMYAEEILNIDNYLDGNTPNLYGISGTELYTKGAAAGKAASSRVFSAGDKGSTLGGYYRDYVQSMGYTPEQLRQFGDQIASDFAARVSSLPELQQAANQILEANGVNENLTGNNLRKAQQQVIRGIIDGAVYTESHNPQRDLGVMTAVEKTADDRAKEAATRAQQQMELSALQSGYKRENGKWVLDEEGIKKKAEMLGIGSYNPEEWEVGPDGKPRRKPKTSKAKLPEEKANTEKGKKLSELDRSILANNKGFDVTFGGSNGVEADRHHYDYVGAISKHGDKWYSGKIHEDNLGHNFPGAWGWASTSNVENAWGNFSLGDTDGAKMRVLAKSEVVSLMNDKELSEHINERLYASGYYNDSIIKDLMQQQKIDQQTAVNMLNENGYKYTDDYQVIAVQNEKPHSDNENYAVAVRTK